MPSSVNLGPTLEGVIDSLIRGGRYQSRSEVMRILHGARDYESLL